ncbi:MAG: hypothetical protein AAGJ34_08190 [Pseudomonadota bacterium]
MDFSKYGNVDFRRIQKAPDAALVFNDLAPITYVADADAYYVTDPKTICDLLRRPEIDLFDSQNGYKKLTEALDLDFDATVTYLNSVPLGLRGGPHQETKRSAIQKVSHNFDEAVKTFETHFRNLAETLLTSPGRTDIFNEIYIPALRAALSQVTGADRELVDHAPEVVLAFDPYVSLKRRLKSNELIKRLFQIPELDQSARDQNRARGLSTLGSDASRGGIGYAVAEVFTNNVGARLSAMPWDDLRVYPAIAFVDRVCVQSFQYGEFAFREGDRIRLWLSASRDDPEYQEILAFGFGKHSCPGRKLALRWLECIKETFRSIDMVAANVELVEKQNSYITVSPKQLWVEVKNG